LVIGGNELTPSVIHVPVDSLPTMGWIAAAHFQEQARRTGIGFVGQKCVYMFEVAIYLWPVALFTRLLDSDGLPRRIGREIVLACGRPGASR
jgi:hypothetical protein